MADRAIEFVQDAHVNAPDKPFYLHYCTGAAHAPHHVPKEWADKYKGRFDAGWDEYRKVVHQRQLEMGIIPAGTELSAHDPDVPEWTRPPRGCPEGLRADDGGVRRVRELHRSHFGRVVDFLEEIGELDNTCSSLSPTTVPARRADRSPAQRDDVLQQRAGVDRGEPRRLDELGGPTSSTTTPGDGPTPGNTPFRRWKRETYRGGTTDPCIVSWPDKITPRGEIRTQYAHIIDFVPTVLDALDQTTGHHPWRHAGTD